MGLPVRQTLTTNEAAAILRKDPRSFARWARSLGVEPVRRMRIGRSWVTLWSYQDLAEATRPQSTVVDVEGVAC